MSRKYFYVIAASDEVNPYIPSRRDYQFSGYTDFRLRAWLINPKPLLNILCTDAQFRLNDLGHKLRL